MKLKIIGTIDLIRPIERRDKFIKCEFSIFNEDGSYYGLQANYKNAFWLNEYKKGDQVEIDFELKGHPYNGKVYNNLLVEKITMLNDEGSRSFKAMKEAKKEYQRNKPGFIKVDLHSKK